MAILAIAPGLVGAFFALNFVIGIFALPELSADRLIGEWIACGVMGAALIASAIAMLGVTL